MLRCFKGKNPGTFVQAFFFAKNRSTYHQNNYRWLFVCFFCRKKAFVNSAILFRNLIFCAQQKFSEIIRK